LKLEFLGKGERDGSQCSRESILKSLDVPFDPVGMVSRRGERELNTSGSKKGDEGGEDGLSISMDADDTVTEGSEGAVDERLKCR
jgi:hypothetical protein